MIIPGTYNLIESLQLNNFVEYEIGAQFPNNSLAPGTTVYIHVRALFKSGNAIDEVKPFIIKQYDITLPTATFDYVISEIRGDIEEIINQGGD